MKTKASVAGHPIHPMLVPLPIGLWIFSLVCDLVYLFKGTVEWSTVALYSLAGGIVGALLAAVPGLIDLLAMKGARVKRIGLWHLGINLAVVALYLANLYWRLHAGTAAGPVLLSVLAVLMLAVSGWLGGEMVYVHKVAVDEERKDTRIG